MTAHCRACGCQLELDEVGLCEECDRDLSAELALEHDDEEEGEE